MSGSDYNLTPNLGLYKPITNHDVGMWGTHWNLNADVLDALFSNGTGTFLPLSGGTMTGLLTVPWIGTTGAINQPCYPVGNSPYPGFGGNPIEAQIVVQGQSTQGSAQSEITAVFGNYVNAGQPNGQKCTLYTGAVQGPLGGTTWSLNSLAVRNAVPDPNCPGGPGHVGSGKPGTPGVIPIANGTIGYELDFTNWDRDCPPGSAFVVGMYIHNQSLFASLAGIYYDSNPQNVGNNNFGWHNGIMFTGAYTIEDNAIVDSSNAYFSYQANGTRTGGTTFYANDIGAVAFTANGSHSQADFWAADNAPIVLQVNGSHTNVVDAHSATISGVAWNGPFSATSLNNTPIGNTTPAAGAFTTLAASGVVSGAGFLSLLASPPAIGGTTPAAGTFTSLTTTSGNVVSGGLTFQSPGANNLYLGNQTHGSAFIVSDGGGSAANLINVIPGTAGFGPSINVLGSDTNFNLNIYAKGTGVIACQSALSVPAASGVVVGTPTIRSGTGAATGTQPSGSLWIRTDGSAGARLYVSAGGGTWAAVAGV